MSPERNPFDLGLMMPVEVRAQELHVDRSTLVLNIPKYILGNKEKKEDVEPGTGICIAGEEQRYAYTYAYLV